jgi:hypothetical protein
VDGDKGTPQQTRAQDSAFVQQCSLMQLRVQLPLNWPTPVGQPASPKKSYRSEYRYPWGEVCRDPGQVQAWLDLSDFDLALRLVDFSGLRPVLAQRLGWKSGRGWEPFDPVSFFLLYLWQTSNRWTRQAMLIHLAEERYADYAAWFGFQNGVFPTEGGMRYFLTRLGSQSEAGGAQVLVELEGNQIAVAVQQLNQLLVQAVELVRQAGLLSPAAWEQALVCPDGQIHDAASRVRCISASESCYQPCDPDHPRLCPAKAKDRQGCACDTLVCSQVCCHATPRDQEARFIVYTGSNQSADSPNAAKAPQPEEPEHGKPRYGYRSLPLRITDPNRRFSLTLLDDIRPANLHEDLSAGALLLQLQHNYPDLHVDAVAGDAAYGFDLFLHTVYAGLAARRVIDCRAHATDRDNQQWVTRGYDNRGRPVCPFGYAFSSFGFDRQRARHKWACDKACLKGLPPGVALPQVTYPPAECPFQAEEHLHGRVINVAETFPDGSLRLVRDVPVGSSTWKALYHCARNAVESRNATFEAWGFKRLSVFGLLRAKAAIFLADVLDTLSTLARLVREATRADLTT